MMSAATSTTTPCGGPRGTGSCGRPRARAGAGARPYGLVTAIEARAGAGTRPYIPWLTACLVVIDELQAQETPASDAGSICLVGAGPRARPPLSVPDVIQRFTWLVGLIAVALAAMFQPLPAQGQKTHDIGSRNQIFLDGRFLTERKNVRIVVQPPRKTGERNIVAGVHKLVAGEPIEVTDGPKSSAYLQVMENDGVFRGFRYVSKNGVDWRWATKEVLDAGDFTYGMRDSVHPKLTAFGVVFSDPHASPEERYKIVSGWRNKVFASADGREWTAIHEGVFPKEALYPLGMDSQNIAFHDEAQGGYVAYVRVNRRVEVPPRHQARCGQGCFLRAVGRSVTTDLASFPMPEIVFEADERDPRFDDLAESDFYMPQVLKYEHAQDAYVMFPNRYLHYRPWFLADDLSVYAAQAGRLNKGPLDVGFASSRDGIHWERYDRKPLIPLGPTGAFDSGGLYPVRGLIFRGDEMWLYFVTWESHLARKEGIEYRPTVSRTVFRRDGFTAVEADYTGGEFTTPQVTFEGGELRLNVDTSALGLLRVEMQDQQGKPIPGFTLEDCDRIHTTNSTRKTVRWRGESSIAALAGKPVRLRFELRYGVKLYSFRFGGTR